MATPREFFASVPSQSHSQLLDSFSLESSRLPTPCWISAGAVNSSGYRSTYFHGKMTGIHVIAYILCHGSVPAGCRVDHLCRRRNCANPDHLEAVTNAENLRRGEGTPASRTHCPRGHLYDVVHKSGRRGCKTCHANYERERRAKKKAGI